MRVKYPGRLLDAQKEQSSHRRADGKGRQSHARPLPTVLASLCSSADIAPRRILGLQDGARDAAHRIAEGRRARAMLMWERAANRPSVVCRERTIPAAMITG